MPSGWPQCSSLELAALPTVVPCGRLHTRQVLREWKLAHLADDAETLVSELLTNAVKALRRLPGSA
jgi:anti-sigma regulatory factor (Ser/Thr protein kinase)